MEINRAKQIIIETLQTALAGQLDPSSNFKPQLVAEAIAAKVEFEKTYSGRLNDELVGLIKESILKNREEMTKELNSLGEDEVLLKNFIRGKITAYMEVLNTLNVL